MLKSPCHHRHGFEDKAGSAGRRTELGRMIRTLAIVGAIAAFSPVHEQAGGEARAPIDPAAIAGLAQGAVKLSRDFAELDPQTRKLMLELAASGIARTAAAAQGTPDSRR
jgi:hypothetical protein